MKIIVANTHLDYADETVIAEQAKIAATHLLRLQDMYQCPIVLVGDMNQYPEQHAIQYLSQVFHNGYDTFHIRPKK